MAIQSILLNDVGAGYDSIDVKSCSSRGILVSNCPKVVDGATADTAVFLILAALRGFNNGIMAIRNGAWTGHLPPEPLGHDPDGKTLGILGFGGIGQNLKRKVEVFDMKVIYHCRNRLPDDVADGAEYVTFDELLARSDVLSLNLPLNVRDDARLPRLTLDANVNPAIVSDTQHYFHQRVRENEARDRYR